MIKIARAFNIDDWMAFISSRNKDKILNLWLKDKEEFFKRYFIIDSVDTITICDKINKSFKDYNKTMEKFKINKGNSKKLKRISIFKLGTWELTKEREL